jgi:hypothetical protein
VSRGAASMPTSAAPSVVRSSAPGGAPEGVRAQILATEHWSLLATRSMLWGEAFTRASIFLTVLSATAVALALVAQTSGADESFLMFAFCLLPVVLFLGLATYLRIAHINNEDGRLIVGMNRLRRGYLDMAPELEPYFITGASDDMPGLQKTVGLDHEAGNSFLLQMLASTPGVVGTINCVVAGVLCGLVGRTLGLPLFVAVPIGVLGGGVLLVAQVIPSIRSVQRWMNEYEPRFPS